MKQFGPYILTLACSFIITLIFFNVLATDTTVKINNINTKELYLQQQIDSLENVGSGVVDAGKKNYGCCHAEAIFL